MAAMLRVIATLTLIVQSAFAAADPATDFDKAVQLDLDGKSELAFTAYLEAARAGNSEAEFNVAIMLDSGRGVKSRLDQAATWYARAAAHGNARAAYNLGQLYESGQGVPRNVELARTWFERSKLPAARVRLADVRQKGPASRELTNPDLVSPINEAIGSYDHGVELVWTSKQEQSSKFHVEMFCVRTSGAYVHYRWTMEVSSAFVPLTLQDKVCSWRVSASLPAGNEWASSRWADFERK